VSLDLFADGASAAFLCDPVQGSLFGGEGDFNEWLAVGDFDLYGDQKSVMKPTFVANDNGKNQPLSPTVPLFEHMIDMEENGLFEQEGFDEVKTGAAFEVGVDMFFQGEGAHLSA